MRIAVIADIHANLPAFKAVLTGVRSMNCEQIYHLGDLICIGPYPAECIDLARENGVRCVTGNHEAWLTEGLPIDPTPAMDDDEFMHQHWTHSRIDRNRRDYVRSFPYRIDEVYGTVRLSFVHFALDSSGKEFYAVDPQGPDEDVLDRFSDIDSDLICFGHLHDRVMDTGYKGRRFLNPGAAGCSTNAIARFSVVDLSGDIFQTILVKVEYDQVDLFRRYYDLQVPAREFIFRAFFGKK